MKLHKIALLVSLAAVAGAGLNGCRLLDDDSDRAPTVNTFTALNNYLQNATCCLDENNNKVCDGGESTGQTDVNAECSVVGNSGNLLVVSDSDTLVSSVKGVLGTPFGAGKIFVAPRGSTVANPLTTLVVLQQELSPTSYTTYEQAEAAVLSNLGLTGINTRTFDYLESGNAQAEVAAELISESLAENLAALGNASSNASQEDLLRAAVNIIVNPNNAAGVQGNGGISVLQAIGQTVSTVNPDAPAPTVTMDDVRADSGVPDIADIPADDLANAVDEAQQPHPPAPTGGTGGSGGSGGAGD